ncbi:MAG: hypothetical protein ACOYN0_01620 [Phycisphaerales bacterium]
MPRRTLLAALCITGSLAALGCQSSHRSHAYGQPESGNLAAADRFGARLALASQARTAAAKQNQQSATVTNAEQNRQSSDHGD